MIGIVTDPRNITWMAISTIIHQDERTFGVQTHDGLEAFHGELVFERNRKTMQWSHCFTGIGKEVVNFLCPRESTFDEYFGQTI